MYLKRLDIQGFKSFAKKTALEFEKGITAIVGPNGSGKSNIADALRWVLGEQSAKLLRGKKNEDVIFAGSDKRLRLSFAETTATFDNRDRKIPLDSAEVSLGRRVDRSGESEYLINGQKARLLDVVDLVLKANIGTSRYTVIGQGMIDQMILAGPAEVKNLIDEASGVKTYYLKREKTLRRLEATAQNLMRAEDLLAEIQPRLKSLRRLAKRMEARGEIEGELKSLQTQSFGGRYRSLSSEARDLGSQLAKLESQGADLKQALQGFLREAEEEEKRSQAETSKYREVEERQKLLQSQKNQLLENLSMVRGKMQSQKTLAKGDAKSLQIEVHRLETELAQIHEQLKDSAASQEQQKRRQAKLNAELRVLEEAVSQALQKLGEPKLANLSDLQPEINAMETALAGLQEQLAVSGSQPSPAIFEAFRQNFFAFKNKFAQLLEGPEGRLPNDLPKLLGQKESLWGELQKLLLELSRQQLSGEFLSRRRAELEQQKLQADLELKRSGSQNSEEFMQGLVFEENKLQARLREINVELSEIAETLEKLDSSERAQKLSQTQREQKYRKLQDELNRLKEQESALAVSKAKVDTQLALMSQEITQALGPEALQAINQAQPLAANLDALELEEKIGKLKKQLETIGGVDELTLKEYEETEERYARLSAQTSDLKQGMQDLRQVIEELDEHIKAKFSEAFHKINQRFENYFRLLFNGGRAYLSLMRAEAKEVAEQPQTEEEAAAQVKLRPEEKLVAKYQEGALKIVGVDIKATPPGKKLSSIQALSGGERALTSIALLCSLLACFPSPFVVLDEVDAALDDANTIRFGQILETLSGQTQFITVTHNRETMTQSHTLYGVTMGDDGISRLLSIKFDQAKAYAK